MGCCGSSDKIADERSSLLDANATDYSIATADKSYQDLPKRPKCKCGSTLNPYELQCCYLTDTGDPFTGSINCENCAKCMSDAHDMIWHCLSTHSGEYTYDLCMECGSNLASDEEKKK
eukprot:289158_1